MAEQRLAQIVQGGSSRSKTLRVGRRVDFSHVLDDANFFKLVHILLFLATWDKDVLGTMATSDESSRDFGVLYTMLRDMVTGEDVGSHFSQVTSTDVWQLVNSALPFVAEKGNAIWFQRLVVLSRWTSLAHVIGDSLAAIVHRAVDAQDLKFADRVSDLIDHAVMAVAQIVDDPDPAQQSATVMQYLGDRCVGAKRTAVLRKVLDASAIAALRRAIDKQKKCSEELMRYAPNSQKDVTKRLVDIIRSFEMQVIAHRSPGLDKSKQAGTVKTASLHQIIETGMHHGAGWQRALMHVLTADGLPGHPLCDSMTTFMDQFRTSEPLRQFLADHIDVCAPFKSMIDMLAEHKTPLVMVTVGGGGGGSGQMQQGSWEVCDIVFLRTPVDAWAYMSVAILIC